jgi:hypothetical protein
MVSFYNFCRDDPEAAFQSRAAKGREEFCRTEIPGWVEHISSYFRATDNGVSIHFVSYDSLFDKRETEFVFNPENLAIVFGDILDWLGVEHTSQMLDRAVANNRFDKSKGTDKQRRVGRYGHPGQGLAELPGPTYLYIREKTESLLREADSRRMAQSVSKNQ